MCRQLDFSFTEAAVPMAGFGAGSGPIFLKDVKCKGFEQSLLKCEHDGWKSHDVNESCDHSMDAGVVCRPHKESKYKFPTSFFHSLSFVPRSQLQLNNRPEKCTVSNIAQNSPLCLNIEIY